MKNKQGFTIIEVVLVLAIAGLIFLMVFLALPALQRSQRDMQRKNDVAIIRAALENYKSSNRGSFSRINGSNRGASPINDGPLASYLGGVSSETEWYWLSGRAGPSGTTSMSLGADMNHRIVGVMFDAECVDDRGTTRRNVGKVAILGSLENGPQSNSPQFGILNYCLDL